MKKFTFSLVVLMLSCIGLYAQQRGEKEVIQIAQNFFEKKGNTSQPSIVSTKNVSAVIRKKVASAQSVSVQEQAYYVVNDEPNNRFVIVSADERMYQILGYSDESLFDAERMPVALLEVLDGYEKQFKLFKEHPDLLDKQTSQRTTTIAVEPLIKTKWGQKSPYNDDCPVNKRASDGSKCYSGCVATAMAQVMNYYQYPTVGNGSYTYISSTQKYLQSFDFSNTTFDWEKMVNVYGNEATDEQKAEVTKLMHACGVAVSMDYGSKSDGQSGAYSCDVPYAMITYFGYNPNMTYKEKDYYTSDEWNAIILHELEEKRPILYSGRGTGGHQFILDGCDGNGLYHFNFGQTLGGDLSYLDGWGNGYYSLDAIKVKDAFLSFLLEQAGAEKPYDLGEYTNDQAMVYNVSPEVNGTHEDVFYAIWFLRNGYAPIVVGQNATFELIAKSYASTTSYKNLNSPKFDGVIGLGLYDTDFNFIKSLYSESFTKGSCAQADIKPVVSFSSDVFINGKQYIIAPYAKGNKSESPTRIRTVNGYGWYLVDVDGEKVTMKMNGVPKQIDYPDIPTGTIFASALGAGGEQVSDTSEKPTVWQLTLTKDANEPAKYWFDNFDPAVSGDNNRVYGFIDNAGTQLSIPVGQVVGNNLSITNYSSSGDIVVSISSADSTMQISDAWGTVETDMSGESASQKQLSFYSSTYFSFKPIPSSEPEPVVTVSKPLIIVDGSKMMSITCSTKDADIYYTLNGKEPSQSSTKYMAQLQLSGNCTIKAVAIKDEISSEIATYEERGFVVSKPVIAQAEENSIEISCSTIGAVIYYTQDGTNPNKNSTPYTGKFVPDESCVIKAIGIRQNYTNSEIATFGYSKSGGELVINNNVAGNLSSRITESEKVSTKGLIVSGDLNGTDIAYLREMIIAGHLTDLNMENANIVSGGDPYYVPQYGKSDYTIDNVVGKNMFDDCKRLISLKLPSSATIIAQLSIWGCTNLKDLQFPISCKKIESNAIYGCKNLARIRLGSLIETFEGNNFSGCNNLEYIDVDADNKTFKSVDGVLYSRNGKVVKYPIGHWNKDVVIPDDVTEIGNNAFDDADIESVVIPEGVVTIGSSAFSGCKHLTKIEIPNSVNKIGQMAFWGCSNLSAVKMPENLSKIESYLFAYCISLRDYAIGKNVKDIADNAFDNCTSLQRYVVDSDNNAYCSENGILYTKDFKTLKRCPQALFSDILIIPDGVEAIASHAFDGCVNIKQFKLPESLVSIGSSAFNDCKMTAIDIPNEVNSIGYMSFWGCDELRTFAFPEEITEVTKYVLYNCEKLEYLYIPSTVKKIESSAFYGCKSLSTIDCRIVDIEMLDVYYSASYDEYTSFEKIPDTCTWRVPYGTVEKYKSRPWWVSSWRIIEDTNLNGIDNMSVDFLSMAWNDGKLSFTSDRDGSVRILGLNGMLIRNVSVQAGRTYDVELPKGIYFVNNKKIVLK